MFALSTFPVGGNGALSDNDSFGSLSGSLTLSNTLPSRLRLPHDIIQEILLLTITLDGSLRQYTPLCLVCRDWDALLNEPYVWATLARRFCPAFPLIHTARHVPIVVPDALALGASDATSHGGGSTSSTAVGGLGASVGTAHRTTAAYSLYRNGGDAGATVGDGMSGGGRGRTVSSGPHSGGGNGVGDDGAMVGGGLRWRRAVSAMDEAVAAGPSQATGSGRASTTVSAAERLMPSNIRRTIVHQWYRRRRQVIRTVREAMREADGAAMGGGGVGPSVPTKANVRAAVEGLLEYQQWLVQSRLVAQRRRFVLQAWMSAGLFFTTCAVAANSCAAEGWYPQSYCSHDVGFSLLYLAYTCVFGVAISNVVMATHFEPLALIPRVSRNTSLIAVSTVFLVAWLLGVVAPTYLVQLKVGMLMRRWEWEAAHGAGGADCTPAGIAAGWGANDDTNTTLSMPTPPTSPPPPPPADGSTWLHTIGSLLAAMGMWQLGVVWTLWRDMWAWLRDGGLWRGRMPTMGDLAYVVPHFTPTLLGASAVAFAHYLDTGNYLCLLVACLPLCGIFGILSIVFAMDAYHHGRESDTVVAMSLGNLVVTFVLLLSTDKPRGLHCLPVFVCAASLFVGQMRSLMRLLDSLLWDPEE